MGKLRLIISIALLYISAGLFCYLIFDSFAELALAKVPEQIPIVETVAAETQTQNQATTVKQGYPKSLSITKLGLNIAVVEGNYSASKQTWSLSPRSAHFAYPPSSLPNDNSGTTYIYGHNNEHVFGRLWQLKNGDTVELTAENGLKFTYSYDKFVNTVPEDTSFLLTKDGPPRLIIQTCTGTWNEKRRLYFYNLVSVE